MYNDKNYGTWRITCKVCDCFLEYTNFKDDLIECKWSCSNKNYQQKFDQKLKNDFEIHKNHDNNKFTLLWPKGVYPDKYMDNPEKLNETFSVT